MIIVAIAMAEEAKKIVETKIPNVEVILTGIGKVNASMKLMQAIEKYDVEAIYNFGFAGANHPYKVGELVLVNEAKYHDFDLSVWGYHKGQVPGYPAVFKSNSELLKRVTTILPEVKTNRLYTGDCFMTEEQDSSFLVDMEGAALYQVAFANNIPIISVKVVSDVIGGNNQLASYEKFEAEKGAILLNDVFSKLFEGVRK